MGRTPRQKLIRRAAEIMATRNYEFWRQELGDPTERLRIAEDMREFLGTDQAYAIVDECTPHSALESAIYDVPEARQYFEVCSEEAYARMEGEVGDLASWGRDLLIAEYRSVKLWSKVSA